MAGFLGFLSPSLSAQTVWTGEGSDANWSTAENWSLPLLVGDDLVFEGDLLTTNNNDHLASVGSITFADGAEAFVLQGDGLTVGGHFLNDSAEVQTIDLDVSFGTGSHQFRDSDTGASDSDLETFVFNGALDYGTGRAFPNEQNVEIILNGPGTGVGSVAGAWQATGPSTFRTNNTTYLEVNEGTALGTGYLQLNGATYLSSSTGVTVANCFVIGTGSLHFENEHVTFANGAVTHNTAGETEAAIVAAGGNRSIVVHHAATTTVAGDIYLSDADSTRTLTLNFQNSGTVEVTGNIHDNLANPGGGGLPSNLNLVGEGGTLILSGSANTFSGSLSLQGSCQLVVNSNNQLSDSATVSIEAAGGALLNLNHSGTEVVTELLIDGVSQGTGTFGAIGSGAAQEVAGLAGSGLLEVLPTAPDGAWNGGGSDNNWTTAENWVGEVVPVPGESEVLTFAGSTRPTANNDFPVETVFGQLSYFTDATSFTLTGHSLVLGNAHILENGSSRDQVIDLPLSFMGSADKTLNTGGQRISFEQPIAFGEHRLFPNQMGGTLSFQAPGTGPGRLLGIFGLNSSTESGVHTVMRVNAANTVLELGHSQALGEGGVQINSPTQLLATEALTGENAVGNTFIVGNSNLEISGSQDLELSGTTQNFQGQLGDTGVSAGAIISAGSSGQNRILSISNTGKTEISGAVYLNDTTAANRVLSIPVLSSAGETLLSGPIVGHVTGGAGNPAQPSGHLSYQGDGVAAGATGGVITVSGNNTYNGDTSIIAGAYVKLAHEQALGAVEVVAEITTEADWTAGSNEVRADEVAGVEIGNGVSGPGIPPGATVTAIGELTTEGYYEVTISETLTANASYPTEVTFSTSGEAQPAGTTIGVDFNNSGTLDLNGFTIAEPILALAGTGSGGGGALVNTGSGPASLTAGIAGVSESSIGGTGAISTPWLASDSSALVTKIGAGTFTTDGAEANRGISWQILEGEVVLANSAGAGAEGEVIIDGATARLTLAGSNGDLISDGSSVTIANGGVLALQASEIETVATLVLAGVAQEPGTYGASGSEAEIIDDLHFSGSGVLQVTSAGGGYAAWASGFPALVDPSPGLDPDGDGLPSAVEWVLGGDPTDATDAAWAPQGELAMDGFQFAFRRSDEADQAADTTIAVAYSPSLQPDSWVVAEDGSEGVTVVTEEDFHGPGVDRVLVTLPPTLATGNKLFVRLEVGID
ncbi:beta strand repeat-containing protein [Roseibacillus ishigakijimensis]|uniref:Autotransporter-associated beta strand repeat-containing protein n=1 Tax=Roseibacillus ishigakijimensis TaxID=454146 RepID=A0A934RND0_9BACT|nr:hypothetical protein [Roseibacillus ishigakijimensis]MBK1834569.1 hypothetical protein [Roseibacillus ishigakijimensis]